MLFRTLVLNAPEPPLLYREIDCFIENDLDVTLNLHYFNDKEVIISHYGDRMAYVDVDGHDKNALMAAILAADGYSVLKTRLNIPIDADIIEAACDPTLKRPLLAIAQAGAGLNHIAVEAAIKRRVVVLNTPGSNANAVAEYVLAQTLFLSRDLGCYNTAMQKKVWAKGMLSPSLEAHELTLGLVGTGAVARATAAKAKALGIKVVAVGSAGFTEEMSRRLGMDRRENLPEMLAEAHVVSIHTPLTAQTRGMFGTGMFSFMRPGSVLINTARGEIVIEAELAAFMKKFPGHIKSVAIDTFSNERASFDSPLVGIPNAILTPHIAGNTVAAISAASREIVKKIAALSQALAPRKMSRQ